MLFLQQNAQQGQAGGLGGVGAMGFGMNSVPVIRQSRDTLKILDMEISRSRLGVRRDCSYIPRALGLMESFWASCCWLSPMAWRSCVILLANIGILLRICHEHSTE